MEAIAPFANHLPVRVTFGCGTARELAAVVSGLAGHRILAFVDAQVASLAPVRSALAALEASTAAVVVARARPGEPTVERIDEAGEFLSRSGCDAVVAIGGGSVLDVAKGARLVATQGGPFRRFAWPGSADPIGPQHLPLVAVPTTSGTGSEVTGGIVAIDGEAGHKVAAPSPFNRPDAAIVDPELTYGLPRAPTLYGGVDALAQGLAASIVRVRTPVGDALGLEAARLVASALPAVIDDPAAAGARSRMACASLLAGLAMNVSEVGTEHSLAHALGARHGLPHGLAVGLVLAESMEHDRAFVPERFERIADALGAGSGERPDGSRAVRAVRALLARVRFPTLAGVGVTEADVPGLVEAALEAWIPVEPGPWAEEDVAAAFHGALAIGSRAE